jgi:hypothetical protein
MPFRLTIEEIKTIMKIEKTQTNDRDELQDAYINEIIDGMDMKDLMRIVYDNLEQNLETYTVEELIEEVEEYYPHLLE